MPHRAKAFNRTYPASSDSEFPPSRSPSPGARDVEMNYGGGGGGGGAGAGGSATGNESDEYGGAYESDEPHTHHRRHLMPPAPSYTSYSRHKRRSATPASSASASASSSTSMGPKWTADEYLQLLDHVLVYGTAKSGFATAVPGRNKNQAYQAWRRVVLPACRAALVAKAQNR